MVLPPRGPAAGAGPALEAVLADPSLLGCAVQPVVDLGSGTVAGWEALTRPDPRLGVGPAELFAEAARDAHALVQLHVSTLEMALGLRATLPPDTFLSVNADPRAVGDPAVLELLEGSGGLHGVVVELLESAWPQDQGDVLRALDRVRACGAMVAVDDVGAGWSGLSQLLAVRPDMVKLDREIVAGLDTDPAAEAVVRAVGELASTLDAWVAVEGVEEPGQLAAAVRLGVPLAQGYLLGRPAPAWPAVDLSPVRASARRRRPDAGLGGLVQVPEDDVLGLDPHGRPRSVRVSLPGGGDWHHPATTMAPSTTVPAALERAMARPGPDRFSPLVVTAADGTALGVVPVELLVSVVVRTAADCDAAGGPVRA